MKIFYCGIIYSDKMSVDISGNTIEVEEEFNCEYCDTLFTTAFECGDHEKVCKAKGVDDRLNKKTKDKKVLTCHICGTTGHHPTNCSIARHIRN